MRIMWRKIFGILGLIGVLIATITYIYFDDTQPTLTVAALGWGMGLSLAHLIEVWTTKDEVTPEK